MTRGIVLAVLLVSLILLAGCGSGQEANTPETSTAQGEPVSKAKETTKVSGQIEQRQGGTITYEDYCIEKQFAEATRGMSQQEAGDYETQVVNEAVARGLDPRTVLAERGFSC